MTSSQDIPKSYIPVVNHWLKNVFADNVKYGLDNLKWIKIRKITLKRYIETLKTESTRKLHELAYGTILSKLTGIVKQKPAPQSREVIKERAYTKRKNDNVKYPAQIARQYVNKLNNKKIEEPTEIMWNKHKLYYNPETKIFGSQLYDDWAKGGR